MPDLDASAPTKAARLILTVLQWQGLGPVTVRRLVEAGAFDSLELEAVMNRLPATKRPSQENVVSSKARCRRILEECHDLKVGLLSLLDSDYPSQLRDIKDAPPLLFCKGDCSALSKQAVAVVGTREASPSGLRAAREAGRALARRQYAVVSGLALGIDTAAHEGALEGGGVTVAVLAHGLQTITPSRNRELATRIVDRNGALMTEHPPGVVPRPPEFVRRNRLQSGLSLASLIVESGIKGGAIHQARFTREQGRALFVVQPKVTTPEFNQEGASFLIDEYGATGVQSTSELLGRLRELSSGKLRSEEVAEGVQESLF